MNYLEAIVLALVQGLTEFLPISSSAHLILVPKIFGWPDQGLAFDVAVHFGTLIAVLWVFRSEIFSIADAFLKGLLGREHSREDSHLGWAILVGTIPIGVAGLALEDIVESELRSPLIIAAATAVFGVLLWVADLHRKSISDEHKITYGKALLIGLAQTISLLPGTSRSGITIMAGLGLGLSRATAARFSFLLSIPAISGAAILEALELISFAGPVDWGAIVTGLIIAMVSAYVCIQLFLKTIDRIGMLPFMLYRLVLAAILFAIYL